VWKDSLATKPQESRTADQKQFQPSTNLICAQFVVKTNRLSWLPVENKHRRFVLGEHLGFFRFLAFQRKPHGPGACL
jgi:hypothetical protein